LIVIDSVAALVPRAEVEWDMWDSYMWLQARMMSQWLRKLSSILAKTGTTCIFINQIRMKIWVMFWNPETTPGWNALKFFASQRIEIRKWEKIMQEKDQIWYFAKIKVAKNKIAAPFKTAELPVKWSMWYEKTMDIIESADILKLISRSWAFYTVWSQKIQWKDKLSQVLMTDEKMRTHLEKEIQNKIKEMRMWKKVLDDDALIAVETEVEADSIEANE
jgi:recombination protein RecA